VFTPVLAKHSMWWNMLDSASREMIRTCLPIVAAFRAGVTAESWTPA
jgi:hypothetical protein